MIGIGLGFVFIIFLLLSSIRIISEYDRAIVFRLGRAVPVAKGPGLVFLVPLIDKIEAKVSIRTITMDIDPQDVITRDNVSLKVNAVLYFKVVEAMKAVLNVENYLYATSQLAQTHLRSILGEHTLDDILTRRDKINSNLQRILDENTDPWGIKVVTVEIKHVDLPPDQQRAMSRQAEAERERRAKIIAAEGELQAAEKLKAAADEMSKNPITIQLRYLQSMASLAVDGNAKTIFFPIPISFLETLKKFGDTTEHDQGSARPQ